MNELKVCFVGIGSIAKRHIRNLAKICSEKKIELLIDAFRREESVYTKLDDDIFGLIHKTYLSIAEMPDNYDVIFLTNPTNFHIEMLLAMQNKTRHFFIEKPLTSYQKLEDLSGIEYRENSVYYVACPLRYTRVIQYLKKNLDKEKIISVRCISSSYLPDWRPEVDYRKTYSAESNLGGGVSIDLIHEWDYIRFLFGRPEKVFYTHGKKSTLEIHSEDYAIYVAEYNDKMVELHLDYFGRKTIREIMIMTDNDTIIGDLVNSKVSFLRENKTIEFNEERDEYQKKELLHFLDMIDGKCRCDNSIQDAYQTLLLTEGVVS